MYCILYPYAMKLYFMLLLYYQYKSMIITSCGYTSLDTLWCSVFFQLEKAVFSLSRPSSCVHVYIFLEPLEFHSQRSCAFFVAILRRKHTPRLSRYKKKATRRKHKQDDNTFTSHHHCNKKMCPNSCLVLTTRQVTPSFYICPRDYLLSVLKSVPENTTLNAHTTLPPRPST